MSTTLVDHIQVENDELRRILRACFAHIDSRADGWKEAKGEFGDCEFGARHEARAIAAQLREIVLIQMLASKDKLSDATIAEIRQNIFGLPA